nr:division/outer membrane stress-associated lipid-binding lipoprotein [secondary endosymbiont of Heteropsylla cubana]
MMLQGCVSTVAIGTTAVVTKTASDPRSFGRQLDDGTLEARITYRLAQDYQLRKGTRIINTVYHGKVLLTGQAPSRELAERAKDLVLGLEGEPEVYNEIRQGKIVSFKQISIDVWITIQIWFHLLKNTGIKSSNVKVITENGEVFLLGLVAYPEGKAIASVASKVNCVKHVITAFSYL